MDLILWCWILETGLAGQLIILLKLYMTLDLQHAEKKNAHQIQMARHTDWYTDWNEHGCIWRRNKFVWVGTG